MDIKDAESARAWLRCWRPQSGALCWLTHKGRPGRGYMLSAIAGQKLSISVHSERRHTLALVDNRGALAVLEKALADFEKAGLYG